MPAIPIDTPVELSPDLAHAESGDQVFVLPLAEGAGSSGGDDTDPEAPGGSPIALSGSARFVWRRLLAAPASVAELATAAAGEYGVAVDEVRGDIHRFVDSLVVRGVLRPSQVG